MLEQACKLEQAYVLVLGGIWELVYTLELDGKLECGELGQVRVLGHGHALWLHGEILQHW